MYNYNCICEIKNKSLHSSLIFTWVVILASLISQVPVVFLAFLRLLRVAWLSEVLCLFNLAVEIRYSKIFILLCQETLSCKLISLSNTCYWFIVNAIEAYKKMVWVVLFAQEQMPWVQMKVPVFLQLFLLKTLWLSDISGCFSTCFWTWYI